LDRQDLYKPIQNELNQVREILGETHREDLMPIQELLSYAMEVPGKLVRPALTLLAAKCCGEINVDHAVEVATAVELLHMASLIQDDTIDEANVRRGRPTVNKIWGRDIAMLVGDFLFSKAAELTCEANDIRIIRSYARASKDASAGELSELLANFDITVTQEQYMERIRAKTASLFSTATEAGGLVSSATQEQTEALRVYGVKLGLAFQIIDDVMDFQSTESDIGKPVTHDLSQGILTLPSILFLTKHPDNSVISNAFQDIDRDENIARAIELIQGDTVMAQTHRVAEKLIREAQDALSIFEPSESLESLHGVATYVLKREQ
jgi:octaprenyl-diphosphate synthase